MLRNELKSMVDSGEMSDGLYRKLAPRHSTAPKLYTVPKIHKAGVPMRPITSMIDSPAYLTANYLTKIIGPVLGKTEHTVKNSKEFVEQLKEVSLSASDKMVSFDVVSLFTKVPVADAIEVVCEKLSSDGTLADRTELSVTTIRRLMEACLECRYFQYQNEFYVQREGAPMGLSLSVVLANAYMEGLEEKLLTSSPLKPAIWRRYVDDTWVLWQHGDDALAEFLNRMNRIHESIQFTMEAETGGKLPFLDVLVITLEGSRTRKSRQRSLTSFNIS